MDPVTGGLIGSGVELLGGILGNNSSAYQQRVAYDQNRSLRQTAYGDTVHSLQDAGLSPMLAFGNGPAAAGNMSGAQQQNPARGIASSVTNALSAQTQKAQIDLLEAQADKTKAETPVAVNTATKLTQETFNLKEQMSEIRARIDNINQNTRSQVDSAELNRYQSALTKTQELLARGTIDYQEAQKQMVIIQSRLQALETNQKKAYSDYYGSEMGKKQPYAEGVEKLGDAAGSVIGGVLKKVIPRKSTTTSTRTGRTTTTERKSND